MTDKHAGDCQPQLIVFRIGQCIHLRQTCEKGVGIFCTYLFQEGRKLYEQRIASNPVLRESVSD